MERFVCSCQSIEAAGYCVLGGGIPGASQLRDPLIARALAREPDRRNLDRGAQFIQVSDQLRGEIAGQKSTVGNEPYKAIARQPVERFAYRGSADAQFARESDFIDALARRETPVDGPFGCCSVDAIHTVG